MKKTLLLPIIAAGALFLAACGGDNPVSSSVVPDPSSSTPAGTSSTPEPEPSSSSVAPRTDIYSSTADNPFSPTELASIMKAAGNTETTNYTDGTVYLKGEVTASSYNPNYSSYTLYLEAGEDTVQIYSAAMSDSFQHDEDWQVADGLVGATVQAQGYGVDYVNYSGEHVYEVGYINGVEGSTPTITSVEFPDDYFKLDKSNVSVALGYTDTVTAAFQNASYSGSVSFSIGDTAVATVSASGLVATVTPVAAGETTLTATSADGWTVAIPVTVTSVVTYPDEVTFDNGTVSGENAIWAGTYTTFSVPLANCGGADDAGTGLKYENPARWYKGGVITITASEGYGFYSLVFTSETASSRASNLANATFVDSINSTATTVDSGYTEGTTVTLTPSSGATSITITNSVNQTRVYSVIVTLIAL